MKFKNILYALVILFIGAFFINGCITKSSNNEKYQITVKPKPADGGTVVPTQGNYKAGREIVIHASPSEGYRFKSWTGDYTSTDTKGVLTLNSDKNITANFVHKTYELTVDTVGMGRVDEKVVKSKSYNSGTEVQLTAHPAAGWQFDHWKGDASGSNNPLVVTVKTPMEITAVFKKTVYELTINLEGEGAVEQQIVETSHAKSYNPGTVVQLTANPGKGYDFVKWKGDLSGSENPDQITMDTAKTVTVVFKGKEYPLNISTQGGGSVSKSPDSTEYQVGSMVKLTANPADGQKFVKWTGSVSAENAERNPLNYEVGISNNLTAVFEESGQNKPAGSGTGSDPYKIANLANLKWVSNHTSVWADTMKQTSNIDASATKDWNNGKGFSQIGTKDNTFEGQYNGGGYTISGLTINRPDVDFLGLFGRTDRDAAINNLYLVEINITGGGKTGGLAGGNKGIITGCYSTGKVTGSDQVGGLVGNNINGVVTESHSTADVTGGDYTGGFIGDNYGGTVTKSYSTGKVSASGAKRAGGLVGFNAHGTIRNSYTTGEVAADEEIGGLTGFNNNGTITNSYAAGKVSGSSSVGGLVGAHAGAVDNSYWDTEATGQESSVAGTGLKTAQMQGTAAKDNMTGFGFDSTWQTNSGDYPTLQENPPQSP